MERDLFIRMPPPKKEYSIRVKITKIEKVKPSVKVSDFDLIIDLDEDAQ